MHRPKLAMSVLAATAIFVSACAQQGEDPAAESAQATETEGATSNSGAGTPSSDAGSLPPGQVTNEDLATLSAVLNEQIPPATEQCVIDRLADDRELLTSLVEAGPDTELGERPLEDQLAVFQLASDCGGSGVLGQFFSDGFAEEAGAPPPQEMTDCVAAALEGDDGPLIMAGFLAFDGQRRPPPETRTAVIDLLTECVPASYLAETVIVDAAADPQLDQALDEACVTDAYADVDLAQPLWATLVDNPGIDFDQLPPQTTASVFGPLFDCISFGQVVANEAAAAGGTISETSIACFDEEFISRGYADLAFAGGELPEDQLSEILLQCLTPDELRQLTGN